MSSRSIPVGEIRPLGEHALLIGVSEPRAAHRLTADLVAASVPGLREVVGGLATVMVTWAPGDDEPDRLVHLLTELGVRAEKEAAARSDDGDAAGPVVQVHCTFDGPDLMEVAEMAGLGVDGVVGLFTAHPLMVAAVGFSPGFAYLAGLPPELAAVPRRERPRPVVPAGSVALAHGHAAVYPSASPGGWQLIGRTDEVFFDPDVAPYSRLAAGDRVLFTAAPARSGGAPPPGDAAVRGEGGWSPPVGGRAVFSVQRAGLHTVFQDRGRPGLAAIGVPGATPADPHSFALANRLVGNAPHATALEVTAGGPTLHCLEHCHVALVGASPEARLDGRPAPVGQVLPVGAGQTLVVGPVRRGLRTYLAVAGGFAAPAVLLSSATDQLSGLGPPPIGAGDRLWADRMTPPLGDHLVAGASLILPEGEPLELRVLPGPHPECFEDDALDALASRRFEVEGESNRVGLRLRASATAAPLRRAGHALELDSQGMVTGAVQVPPHGDPVILLGDHATLGGYPVIAVVVAADHRLLGQCGPGAQVRLVPVDRAAARAAWVDQQHALDAAIVGHYPLVVE